MCKSRKPSLPDTSRRVAVDAGGLNPECDVPMPLALLGRSHSIARCRPCLVRPLGLASDPASPLATSSYLVSARARRPPRVAARNARLPARSLLFGPGDQAWCAYSPGILLRT